MLAGKQTRQSGIQAYKSATQGSFIRDPEAKGKNIFQPERLIQTAGLRPLSKTKDQATAYKHIGRQYVLLHWTILTALP